MRDRARKPDFPAPVWKVGRTKLYIGWEVWAYLEEREFLSDSLALKEAMDQVKSKRTFITS